MHEAAIIRSMTSKEGSHPRATYLMHTGYLPTASVKYPSFGSIVGQQLPHADLELPAFVRVGGNGCRTAPAAASWASNTIRS